MKHDERLIEVVARGIVKRRGDDPDRLIPEQGDAWPLWTYFTDDAAAALDAINVSGIAWVAPWHSTEAMLEFEAEHTWAMMRDAHLAKQERAALDAADRRIKELETERGLLFAAHQHEMVRADVLAEQARWLRVEDVPDEWKDGRELEGWDARKEVRSIIRWDKHNHVPLYGWIRHVELYGEEVDGFDPTHVRAIPPPPAATEDGEREAAIEAAHRPQ